MEYSFGYILCFESALSKVGWLKLERDVFIVQEFIHPRNLVSLDFAQFADSDLCVKKGLRLKGLKQFEFILRKWAHVF